MKSNEMINQIKTLLNIEVKLEEMKLENGTVITADSFKKDSEVFIVTDDEKVAMPVGEYILEDGKLLVVSEEGIIDEMKDVSDEVPAKEMEDKEEEITSDLADEGNYVTKDDYRQMEVKIQNLEDAIADLKGDKESKMEDVQEEEMSEEQTNVLKSRTVKEEFSEASAKPIKHNPETVSEQKKKVEFTKAFNKFGATSMERVLNRLNK